ncbi:unnamed protein product [Candidula unifasciata]|uniref:Uncharacterized protein n=1 Tax=Candidula unifasciata TaxID=100452 RepID=A0A8S4A035_9EUPU|nr:unnamed protein product [Candidula unifasciata]
MGKFIKTSGKVVLVLEGWGGGGGGITMMEHEKPYLVVGIERYPRKLTRSEGTKQLKQRYNVDFSFEKSVVNKDIFRDSVPKSNYKTGKNKCLFHSLRLYNLLMRFEFLD